MRVIVVLVVLAACGRGRFQEDPLRDLVIPHLPVIAEWEGTGDLVFDASVIDTTNLAIDGAPPTGAWFFVVPQAGGPEIAVLQTDSVRIASARVIGHRPLVIVARDSIDVLGVLDAGAAGASPGPGARDAAGAPGIHTPDDVCDSGGGGGGHGTAGGNGGDATCGAIGGGGSAAIDEPAILAGGAAGGDGVSGACGIPAGGGGGGALQLTAADRVHVTSSGLVTAGGGGGAGGPECGDGDAGAGAGGGAGGSIVLQGSPSIIDGLVIAHGGGGGGGGNGDAQNGAIGVGGTGADGNTLAPAPGGAAPAANAGTGGSGGTEAQLPATSPPVEHNAGGGGGAVGRITIHGASAGSGTISPAPAVAP